MGYILSDQVSHLSSPVLSGEARGQMPLGTEDEGRQKGKYAKIKKN